MCYTFGHSNARTWDGMQPLIGTKCDQTDFTQCSQLTVYVKVGK
jgi:hypothetical protein